MAKQQQERLRELAAQYEAGTTRLYDEDLLALLLSHIAIPGQCMATVARHIMAAHEDGLDDLATTLANRPLSLVRFGLTTSQVYQLQMAYELVTRCHSLQQVRSCPYIHKAEDVVAIMQPELIYLDHEEMHVLVLDNKNRLLERAQLYKGTVNSSVVRAAEVFRLALLRNSPRIVVCHNHPSGHSWPPSPEDVEITIQLLEAGKLLEIELLDHVIIGKYGHVSLHEQLEGKLPEALGW